MEVKNKKRSFTISDKFKIIEDIENGKSQAQICAKMKLSKSTVSNIWNNRHKIKNDRNINVSRKKLRPSSYPDVEERLYKWFQQRRANNIPISGPMLKLKAEEFGKLTRKDFKCSSGWLDRFKKKHNIVFGKMCEKDAENVNNTIVQHWMSQIWPVINKKFSDETDIFYKTTPSKTHRFKNEKCNDDAEDNIPLNAWLKMKHFMDINNFEEYVNIQKEMHTTQELTDQEIVPEIQDAEDNEVHLYKEERNCEEDDAEEQTISSAQALDYIGQLRQYFQSDGANKRIYSHLDKLESDIVKKANVQT